MSISRWLKLVDGTDSEGAALDALDSVEAALSVTLPDDYRNAMLEANGGDTDFGKSWVILWPVEEVVHWNVLASEFRQGLTLFGTNGGGEDYAWDWRSDRHALYVVVPSIGGIEDAIPCGHSFDEFLRTLFDSGIPYASPESSTSV